MNLSNTRPSRSLILVPTPKKPARPTLQVFDNLPIYLYIEGSGHETRKDFIGIVIVNKLHVDLRCVPIKGSSINLYKRRVHPLGHETSDMYYKIYSAYV